MKKILALAMAGLFALNSAAAPAPEAPWVSVDMIVIDGTPSVLIFTASDGHQLALSPADCQESPGCMKALDGLVAKHAARVLKLSSGKTQV